MANNKRPGLSWHRRIAVWNFGIELVGEIYRLTRTFPREELFVLTSQLRRAAISIPSNIAEGNQRRTVPDRRRFLTGAQGSLAEIETQLEIASRLGYLSDGDFIATLERTDHIGRMLTHVPQHAQPSLAVRPERGTEIATRHSKFESRAITHQTTSRSTRRA